MKSPAFQFYPADYLADAKVQALSIEGEGCYFRLLCYCWREGFIPADRGRLSRLCKGYDGPGIDEAVSMFRKGRKRGTLIHGRLEQERQAQAARTRLMKESGSHGAEKRWNKARLSQKIARLSDIHLDPYADEQWPILVEACENKCVRCGVAKAELHGGSLTRDHIIPRHMGGNNSISNIQPVCRNCNSSKSKETIDYRPSNWIDSFSVDSLATLLPIAFDSSSSSSSSSSSASALNPLTPFEKGGQKKPNNRKTRRMAVGSSGNVAEGVARATERNRKNFECLKEEK